MVHSGGASRTPSFSRFRARPITPATSSDVASRRMLRYTVLRGRARRSRLDIDDACPCPPLSPVEERFESCLPAAPTCWALGSLGNDPSFASINLGGRKLLLGKGTACKNYDTGGRCRTVGRSPTRSLAFHTSFPHCIAGLFVFHMRICAALPFNTRRLSRTRLHRGCGLDTCRCGHGASVSHLPSRAVEQVDTLVDSGFGFLVTLFFGRGILCITAVLTPERCCWGIVSMIP